MFVFLHRVKLQLFLCMLWSQPLLRFLHLTYSFIEIYIGIILSWRSISTIDWVHQLCKVV